VRIHVALFTNLTQDHLDYHGSMAAYGEAKQRLFAGRACARRWSTWTTPSAETWRPN
jgi:UDP-N-acetylmuramoylalanine-D-glutamate ligase